MRINLLALVPIALLTLAGCNSARNIVGLNNPEPIPVYRERLSLSEITDAIRHAASTRGWEVIESGPNYLLLTNLPDAATNYSKTDKARHVTLRAEIDRSAVTLAYISTDKLAYTYITDEKQAVRYNYNQMINSLNQAIRFELDKRTAI